MPIDLTMSETAARSFKVAPEEFEVMCCFCGGGLANTEAVELGLTAPEDRNAAQGDYAHARCVADRFHPDVPLLPEILDRADRERGKSEADKPL